MPRDTLGWLYALRSRRRRTGTGRGQHAASDCMPSGVRANRSRIPVPRHKSACWCASRKRVPLPPRLPPGQFLPGESLHKADSSAILAALASRRRHSCWVHAEVTELSTRNYRRCLAVRIPASTLKLYTPPSPRCEAWPSRLGCRVRLIFYVGPASRY